MDVHPKAVPDGFGDMRRAGGGRAPGRVEGGLSATYGYARVSARDQSLARQLDALRAFPVPEKNIVCDKASGKDFARPGYQGLLRRLREGDVLVIMSIDRLGRNYEEILNQWHVLTQDVRVSIVVLDMPLLDTRERAEDVTGAFLADVMLQLLSYVAEVERGNTRRRQAEGIEAARRRGVRFGRPPLERPKGYEQAKEEYLSGVLTRKQAAKRLKVSVKTFDKWRKLDMGIDLPE